MGLDLPQKQHRKEESGSSICREPPSADRRSGSIRSTELGCEVLAGERERAHERDGGAAAAFAAGHHHGQGNARCARVEGSDGGLGLAKGDFRSHNNNSDSDEGSYLEMEYPTDDNLNDDEETGLTTQQRKQKGLLRRKRREETDGKEVALSLAQKHLADQAVVRRLAVNVMFILLWYLFSVSISLVRCPLYSP